MKRIQLVIAIAMLIVIVISGCTQTPAGQVVKEDTIKIGVIGTFTGVGAYHGQQERRGVEIAKDEINAAGGINGKKIELIYEDTRTDPKTAVSAVNKLISVDDVKYIIGDSWASTTVVLLPTTNNNKVIMISGIAMLESMSKDDYFFRTVPSVKTMMQVLAEYAYNELGSRRAGSIISATPYGEEHNYYFKQAFEKLGGEIVMEQVTELIQKDVRTELLKLRNAKVDTVINLHTSGLVGIPMKQAKETEFKPIWLAHFGSQTEQLITDYGGWSNGLVYPYPYDSESEDESVKNFIMKYKVTYNEIPDMTAANSYDALKVLAYAIENVGEDTDDIKEFLVTVKDFPGASGKFSFDKNGDVEKEILIKKVENREFVRVG
ncbi:ABC transporter substrate-binding protein [Candidatus Woesearchaeota archaeon]|nr:ABC transporter substrate-binding protein [Candidatus Woesearchaeota archaeon]